MRSTDRLTIEDVRCEIAGISHTVADLSVGGFFVVSDPPLPVGHSVAVDVVFPDGWRVSAIGRVAWVNGLQEERRPNLPIGFGVNITKIAFTDKLALIDRLRRALRQPEAVPARTGRPTGPVPLRRARRKK